MNEIREFFRLVDEWSRLMDDGNAEAANVLYDRINAIYKIIVNARQEVELFGRAHDANDAACLFIASHIKDYDRAKAIALYQRLLRSPQPFIVMSAQAILEEMGSSGT
jgi:hypothetical protein